MPKCAHPGVTRSGDGGQHFEQIGFVVRTVEAAALEPDAFTRQAARDERGLAVADDALAVVIERCDLPFLGRRHRAGSGHASRNSR